MLPPQHEHKTNTGPFCVGDHSPSLTLMPSVLSYSFCPCFFLPFFCSFHLVNWTLAVLRCFCLHFHHSGQITLSFTAIGLGSLAAPSTRGLHKATAQFLGYFRAKIGARNEFHSAFNLRPLINVCSMLYTVTDLSRKM